MSTQTFLTGNGDQRKTLVVVFLRGGADGLNMVAPTHDDGDYRARPRIAIAASEATRLDGQFGLNPLLKDLAEPYRDGALLVVHAAGSEDTTRSHFEAQDLMERAGEVAGGWLGRYLRFEMLDYHRIPGLGLLATLMLLLVVGAIATRVGQGPLARVWDRLLTRIPGVGIVYGSTKSLGEALLNNQKEETFRKVVLVQWPHPGMWRVGFLTGHVSDDVKAKLGYDVSCVFVPHTPNPASGFVHYVPKRDIIELDWAVEDGLKVIVSGGVVQPGMEPPTPAPKG